MKIRYLATTRFPDVWANTLQTAKTCEALARAGAEVELVVPCRHSTSAGDPFEQMGVAPLFTLRRLWTLDLMWINLPFTYPLMVASYMLSLAGYLAEAPQDSVLYMRGELVVPIARLWGRKFPIIWETHEPPKHISRYRKALARVHGVVTVTNFYRDELIQVWGLAPDRVRCVRDAVDIAAFAALPAQEAARGALHLPLEKKLAVYTGSNLSWKGLDALRAAAQRLPREWLVAFVGDIAPEKEPHSLYPGYRPRKEIPDWLAAADVLVLTGTTKSNSSARYTSPMKLFEYMAAGRPIVASDLPSLREVLDDSSAYFASPDDPAALATAIERAARDPERWERAERARALARDYTWEARGTRIIEFIKLCL